MQEQNSFRVHCYEYVVLKFGDEAAFHNWFWVCKKTQFKYIVSQGQNNTAKTSQGRVALPIHCSYNARSITINRSISFEMYQE